MDPLRLHLALAHAPVFAALFGVILLTAAALRRSGEMQRAGLITLVAAGALAVPTFISGTCIAAAAQVPEKVRMLEVHETAGLVALVAAAVLGVVSLGVLLAFRRRAQLPRAALAVTLVLGVLTWGLMLRASGSAGQMRLAERAAAASEPEPLKASQERVGAVLPTALEEEL